MKPTKILYYYFQVGLGYTDLKYILLEIWKETDPDDLFIWMNKLSKDTNKIRVDSVESKVLKAMFR